MVDGEADRGPQARLTREKQTHPLRHRRHPAAEPRRRTARPGRRDVGGHSAHRGGRGTRSGSTARPTRRSCARCWRRPANLPTTRRASRPSSTGTSTVSGASWRSRAIAPTSCPACSSCSTARGRGVGAARPAHRERRGRRRTQARVGQHPPGRFALGAYGSDHATRAELPAIAAARAEPHFGRRPDRRGDRDHRRHAGRRHLRRGVGARAIGVATGAYTTDDLRCGRRLCRVHRPLG